MQSRDSVASRNSARKHWLYDRRSRLSCQDEFSTNHAQDIHISHRSPARRKGGATEQKARSPEAPSSLLSMIPCD